MPAEQTPAEWAAKQRARLDQAVADKRLLVCDAACCPPLRGLSFRFRVERDEWPDR